MGSTIAEKILARASGTETLAAGEITNAKVSFVMTNDAVGELTADALKQLGADPWDRDRVAVVMDHYIPASSENAARVHKLLRDFSKKHGVHLFDQVGVCHQIMVERFVSPGDLVIGTDSHTCTYGAIGAFATGVGSTDGAAAMATGKIWLKVPETIRVELKGRLRQGVYAKDVILSLIGQLGADGATYKCLEFGGDGASTISTEGRLTICNMAIEAGAKTGIFPVDDETQRFMLALGRTGIEFASDQDAEYSDSVVIDLSRLEPQVACPWAVDNVVALRHVVGTHIDQAFIGSCTNGRLSDLRVAAETLALESVHPDVRLLVTPASRAVYEQALSEGLIGIFVNAGAIVCNPGCSACFGGQGMLWDGEVCIGTHNRNFRARMGHKNSRVYLASPRTVAMSAVRGRIHGDDV